MSDFDAVFDQLAADAKAPRDLLGRVAREHCTAKRRKGNKRRGAHRIGRFFVGFVVVTSKDPGRGYLSLWEKAWRGARHYAFFVFRRDASG